MSLCSILCIHALKTRLKQNKAKAIQKGNKNLFFFFFPQLQNNPQRFTRLSLWKPNTPACKCLSVWQTVPWFLLEATNLAKWDHVIFRTTAQVSLNWQWREFDLWPARTPDAHVGWWDRVILGVWCNGTELFSKEKASSALKTQMHCLCHSDAIWLPTHNFWMLLAN